VPWSKSLCPLATFTVQTRSSHEVTISRNDRSPHVPISDGQQSKDSKLPSVLWGILPLAPEGKRAMLVPIQQKCFSTSYSLTLGALRSSLAGRVPDCDFGWDDESVECSWELRSSPEPCMTLIPRYDTHCTPHPPPALFQRDAGGHQAGRRECGHHLHWEDELAKRFPG
jgi:hypothetical protein